MCSGKDNGWGVIHGLLGQQVNVPKRTESMVRASMKTVMVLLRKPMYGCDGPWTLFQAQWHFRKATIERKRMCGFAGGESSFLKRNLINRGDAMISEVFEAPLIVARRIQSVLCAKRRVISKVLEGWLCSDAESEMHDVVRMLLIMTPSIEIDRMGFLLSIEIDDLECATSELNELKQNRAFSTWSIWIFMHHVAEYVVRERCGWVAGMRSQECRSVLLREKNKNQALWSLSAGIDHVEVQADEVLVQQATPLQVRLDQAISYAQGQGHGGGQGGGWQGNGFGGGRGGGGAANHNGKQNGGGGKRKRQGKDHQNDGGGRNNGNGNKRDQRDKPDWLLEVLAARREFKAKVKELGSKEQFDGAIKLCAMFGLGKACRRFDAQNDPDNCWSKGKQGAGMPFKHLCFCGGKHAAINCKKWIKQ